MKKIIYILSIFTLLLSSCYEDNSNDAMTRINPIIINLGPDISSEFNVQMFDTLKINPIIYKEGLPDAKLTFEWHLSGNAMMPKMVGHSMNLAAYITAKPESAPYQLRLTVSDELGICKSAIYEVYVTPSLQQGLVVADTEDGINTDFSVILDYCFNSKIDKSSRKIHKNIFSQVNGAPLKGLVRDLKTTNQFGNKSITITTEYGITRADHYEYSVLEEECNEGIFIVPPKKIDATTIVSYTQKEFMVVNGNVYPRSTSSQNRKYSFYLYPPGQVYDDYNVTYLASIPSYGIYGFDSNRNKMIFFNGNNCWYAKDQAASNVFDVNDLSDYEIRYMGRILKSRLVMYTKQKSTGKHIGLIINNSSSDTDKYAGGKFDYSNLPEINAAKYFTSNTMEDVLYYATDTKLYSSPFFEQNAKLQYETSGGDKITDIMVYTEAGGSIAYYDPVAEANGYDAVLAVLGRMMLITTYNETTKEGKVVAIPIITLHIGELEKNPKFHIIFDGFHRILKIAKQAS